MDTTGLHQHQIICRFLIRRIRPFRREKERIHGQTVISCQMEQRITNYRHYLNTKTLHLVRRYLPRKDG